MARTKGAKALTKVEGGVVNQYGVFISDSMRKEYTKLVNAANYKRKKQLADLERLAKGAKDKTVKKNAARALELEKMGAGSDFIIQKKSTSLQELQSDRDLQWRIAHLQEIKKKGFLDRQAAIYKENFLKAVRENLPNSGDIIKAVEKMKPGQYFAMVQLNENTEIGHVYGPGEAKIKANQIRRAIKLHEQHWHDATDQLKY